VALARTDASDERITSIIRLTIIGEAPYALRLPFSTKVVPSSTILVTMIMEAIQSFETSVRTKATRRHIARDGILYSHRLENLKSYIG
jgi:hypothetical protein